MLALSTVERNHGCASGCGQDKNCGARNQPGLSQAEAHVAWHTHTGWRIAGCPHKPAPGPYPCAWGHWWPGVAPRSAPGPAAAAPNPSPARGAALKEIFAIRETQPAKSFPPSSLHSLEPKDCPAVPGSCSVCVRVGVQIGSPPCCELTVWDANQG